jgi:TPR repeat protein
MVSKVFSNPVESMSGKALFDRGLSLFGAFKKREALAIAEQLIEERSPYGHLLAAYVYEIGGDGVSVDYDKALFSYEAAIQKGNFAGAQLGAVRVLLCKGGRQNIAKATAYCEQLIRTTNRAINYMVLGRIYESYAEPVDIRKAQRLYFIAGLKGLASGFRACARLEHEFKSRILGGVLHVLVSMVSPIMRLLLGRKTFSIQY